MSIEEVSVPRKAQPAPDTPSRPSPDGSGAGAPPWSQGAGPWLLLAAVMLLIGGVVALVNTHIPYYEFHPGSARPVADLVAVDGVDTYPVERDIAFTTVSLRQSTVGTWVLAHFDDDVEVRTEEEVLGERTPSENREFNRQLMDTSKLDAARAALVALGYDVPIEIDGEFVVDIEAGSAADGVLRPGDVIVALDGQRLRSIDDVQRVMNGRGPGDQVRVRVEGVDDGTERTLDVTLGPAEDDPDRGIIGVLLQPRGLSYDFPFEVGIDSGNVGGPSAGLAFSLGVLDVLTPGDLTGGHDVAVTGTIDALGNVGLVGGVPQKTAAVVDGGYDVFLVPSAEVAPARERAGDAVEVIGVDTLDQALDALASLGGSGLSATPE